MQKFVALTAIFLLLAGCGVRQGYYQGAPAVPADAPPPTSLLSQ